MSEYFYTTQKKAKWGIGLYGLVLSFLILGALSLVFSNASAGTAESLSVQENLLVAGVCTKDSDCPANGYCDKDIPIWTCKCDQFGVGMDACGSCKFDDGNPPGPMELCFKGGGCTTIDDDRCPDGEGGGGGGGSATAIPTSTQIPTSTPSPPPGNGGDGGGDEPEPAVSGFVLDLPSQYICVTTLSDVELIPNEEQRMAMQWAIDFGVVDLTKGRICLSDWYHRDFVVETGMALPAYRGIRIPLVGSKFIDTYVVNDNGEREPHENEPLYALWYTAGFYPKKLWCKPTDEHLCPSWRAATRNETWVEREEAHEWAMLEAYGPRVWARLQPDPYEGFLEEFPDVEHRREFISAISSSVTDLGYSKGIGPDMFCPYGPFCRHTKIQRIVLLYRVFQFHLEHGFPPESPLYEDRPAPFWEEVNRPPTPTPAPTAIPATPTPTP